MSGDTYYDCMPSEILFDARVMSNITSLTELMKVGFHFGNNRLVLLWSISQVVSVLSIAIELHICRLYHTV